MYTMYGCCLSFSVYAVASVLYLYRFLLMDIFFKKKKAQREWHDIYHFNVTF